MSIFDPILSLIGFGESTAIVSDQDLRDAFAECASENKCEAAWQTSYAYAAELNYKLAVFQALQGVVFGTIQYASADRTADLQYDIADRQMVIAEEEYARYKELYVPCEDALNAEVCAMECPEADYEMRASRVTRDVRSQFSVARRKIERTRNRYCVSDFVRDMCDLNKAEAMAVVQARDIAYRTEEERVEFLDEKRWSRRLQMLTHGRNIKTDSSSQYMSAMGPAIEALQAGQNSLDTYLGTLSGAVGSIAMARTNRIYANSYYDARFGDVAGTGVFGVAGSQRPVPRPPVSGVPYN